MSEYNYVVSTHNPYEQERIKKMFLKDEINYINDYKERKFDDGSVRRTYYFLVGFKDEKQQKETREKIRKIQTFPREVYDYGN